MQETDEELMKRLSEGHKNALAELFDRYSGKLQSYFFRMLNKDTNRAKDLTQDIFITLIEKSSQFDPNRNFKTWIFTIALNMCKNEYKKLKIRDDYKEHYSMMNEDVMFFEKDIIDNQLFARNLKKILASMDDDHKTAFILRYQQDMTIKEISEIMGIPEGTVKSRLFYTIRFLSEKLSVFNPKMN